MVPGLRCCHDEEIADEEILPATVVQQGILLAAEQALKGVLQNIVLQLSHVRLRPMFCSKHYWKAKGNELLSNKKKEGKGYCRVLKTKLKITMTVSYEVFQLGNERVLTFRVDLYFLSDDLVVIKLKRKQSYHTPCDLVRKITFDPK